MGAVNTCFYDLSLGFEHPNFILRGQRSYPLRYRTGLHNEIVCHLKFYAVSTIFQPFFSCDDNVFYYELKTVLNFEENIGLDIMK